MNHRIYSLHKIHSSTNFGFDAADYSRFKYGDDAVAARYGTALADGFIQEVLSKNPPTQQLVVISSPYSFIPTATFALKNHFVFRLNRWLAQNGIPVVQEAKVHRTITYKEDYGALDAEQRMSLISNDSFHIDAGFLTGKALIFLDDIKITGSHERMISKMIREYDLRNETYMLYFAELVNMDIPPTIENYLNYHEVKTIFDLDRVINGGHFIVNTRIVKYILNYEHKDFCIFIEYQSKGFINQLYDMALGNGYHTMDNYSINLNYLRNLLLDHETKLVHHGN
ncbi:phosphoribosyltransferase family protein [uncultured Mucilaginibacter sp.]|uniref:phosphoribosyltransferase family protein n=1 Tax=uncultured Mucilaginibacter sp. TaxID=797541 RepID=UPI0025F41BB4|nr:phosphoribosyltransferase family protein [uncultured Mucilaginibacter sp.]